MNSIIIHGRLCREVESKITTSGDPVASFSVAVNRQFKRDVADFFEVTAWRKLAELCAGHLSKGSEVIVKGEMQCEKWQDKDGKNRYTWKLVADSLDFCGKKGDLPNGAEPNYSQQPTPKTPEQREAKNEFNDFEMDQTDIPF